MTDLPQDVEHLGIVPVEVEEPPEGPKVDGERGEPGQPVAEDDPSNLTGGTITGKVTKPYPDDYVEVEEGADGDWYWRRKAGNHQVISHGEGYESGGSKTASAETQAAGAIRGALRANPDLDESDITVKS